MNEFSKIFSDFKAESGISMQNQVKAFIRSNIQEKHLKKGTRLPSMRELACFFDTNYFTVNKAIKELVHEGFLQKIHSVGTFVSDRPQRLNKVGLYVHVRGQHKEEMMSCMHIQSALQIQMAQQHIENKVIVDSRPDEQRNEILPELVDAIKTRSIEALIVLSPRYMMRPWLEKLSIPCVLSSSSDIQNGVTYNCLENMETICDRCQELGCRSIGLISHVPYGGTHEKTPTYSDYFKMASQKYNIELRDEWLITPNYWIFTNMMEYGYQAFGKFMKLKKKPEMLVLLPDTTALGCVSAIMESHIKIPQELKILVATNKEIAFNPPFPIDRLEQCCFNMATGLLNQLDRIRQNKKVLPMKLRAELIRNKEVESSSIMFV